MDHILQWTFIGMIVIFIVWRFLPVKGINNITVQEAKHKMKDKKTQFIDVRTPAEYKTFHEKRFKNIPLSSLNTEINQLNKEVEVVLICQSGMRSMRAAKTLKKHGFQNISNVKGGMSAWR